MKSLYDVALANEVVQRVQRLRVDSERQWGKMTVAQAVAHCGSGLEMALGEMRSARAPLIGRLMGSALKPFILGNDGPFRRNSPTLRELTIRDDRDLDVERARLCSLINKFASGGTSACTTHPHPLLGPLAPQEWAGLMYKHLDHHLRQFGV